MKQIATRIAYSFLSILILSLISGAGYGGYLIGHDKGYEDAQRQAIKEGLAYHHPVSGDIVWGIREANSIAVALEPIGRGKK
jgi:hypothetical protein